MHKIRPQERVFIKLADKDYSDKYDFCSNENVVERLISYIIQPSKAEREDIFVCNMYNRDLATLPEDCARQFYAVQALNNRFDIANEDKLIHIIVAFPFNMDLYSIDHCRLYLQYIAQVFISEHQLVCALHTNNTKYGIKGPHIHFIINPVSFVNGQYLRITTTHLAAIYNILSDCIYKRHNVKIPRPDYYINYSQS